MNTVEPRLQYEGVLLVLIAEAKGALLNMVANREEVVLVTEN